MRRLDRLLSRTPLGAMARHAPFVQAAYARVILPRPSMINCFDGCYDSYEEAVERISDDKRQGWDDDHLAKMLAEGDPITIPSLYPSYFWLEQLLGPRSHVIDWGGGVGHTYYEYVKRTRLYREFDWTIVEMPAIAAAGQRLAADRAEQRLRFDTELRPVEANEIMFSNGAVQYMSPDIFNVHQIAQAGYASIILNKVPLINGREFWTLQNLGNVLCPYRVFNRSDFISAFEQNGYQLLDEWPVLEIQIDFPFYPDRAIKALSGLVFERKH